MVTDLNVREKIIKLLGKKYRDFHDLGQAMFLRHDTKKHMQQMKK